MKNLIFQIIAGIVLTLVFLGVAYLASNLLGWLLASTLRIIIFVIIAIVGIIFLLKDEIFE